MSVALTLPVGDSLELRLLGPADAPHLSSLVSAHLGALTPWLPHLVSVSTLDGAKRFLEAKTLQWQEGRGAEWGVWEGRALVGAAWLTELDRHNLCADLGYWLAPPARGRGIATDCCRAMLGHAFEELGLHRISIRCIADNVASRAIPQRLGFREEATIREAWKVHGAFVDHVIYGLLAREWREGERGGSGRIDAGAEIPGPTPL